MNRTKRQVDGRTLYVLALWTEFALISDDIPENKRAEARAALDNARWVLEHVELGLKEEGQKDDDAQIQSRRVPRAD